MAWDLQVVHEGSACERWSFHVIHEGFASKDYLSILLIVPFWCVLLVLLSRPFFQNDEISLGFSNSPSSCFFLVLPSCCFILVHFDEGHTWLNNAFALSRNGVCHVLPPPSGGHEGSAFKDCLSTHLVVPFWRVLLVHPSGRFFQNENFLRIF